MHGGRRSNPHPRRRCTGAWHEPRAGPQGGRRPSRRFRSRGRGGRCAPNQFALLCQKRFARFFWTQFAGAADDNLFKFALLPQVLHERELTGGKGMVEMGTFVAVLLGDVPLAGFFAAGEIAHDRLYGYTGVLTVFIGGG